MREELEKLVPSQPLPANHSARAIRNRQLENRLCEIDGDKSIVSHDGLLLCFHQQRLWHIDADRVAGGVHLINEADRARRKRWSAAAYPGDGLKEDAMRATLMAMTVMVVAFGQAQAELSKSMPADVGPGRVAWFDITTTDLSKSKEFYGKLFEWKFNPVQGTDHAVEIVAGGAAIGTIRVAEGQISSFNGVVYVQVPDIQDSCTKAKELGATLVPGFPFDLPNGTGAIGLISDPAGHPLGMYSRTPLVPKKPASK